VREALSWAALHTCVLTYSPYTAVDVVVLEQDRDRRYVADYVVIASARSERHLHALGRRIVAEAKTGATFVRAMVVSLDLLGLIILLPCPVLGASLARQRSSRQLLECGIPWCVCAAG
jgi:hypothetical protein